MWEDNKGWTFPLEEGLLWIMDWYFGQKQWFKVKCLNDLIFFANKLCFSLPKMLIDGLESYGLLDDYYDANKLKVRVIWSKLLDPFYFFIRTPCPKMGIFVKIIPNFLSSRDIALASTLISTCLSTDEMLLSGMRSRWERSNHMRPNI